jgi:hypothetical protein
MDVPAAQPSHIRRPRTPRTIACNSGRHSDSVRGSKVSEQNFRKFHTDQICSHCNPLLVLRAGAKAFKGIRMARSVIKDFSCIGIGTDQRPENKIGNGELSNRLQSCGNIWCNIHELIEWSKTLHYMCTKVVFMHAVRAYNICSLMIHDVPMSGAHRLQFFRDRRAPGCYVSTGRNLV